MTRALALALLLVAATAHAQCVAPNLIQWPANAPVWRLCWLSPDASGGTAGSGIELRHVFYKGKRVLWRANVPVLNVLYDQPSGACGPSYRDWFNSLQPFDANNVLMPGYAEPTVPPRTVCEKPGADIGSFAGVAVEKLADRLVLTSQAEAGWYRYIERITFHADGTIEPQFGFTAVEDDCVSRPHMHHGYWRFDFDIDGFASDRVEERHTFLWFFPWWVTLSKETSALRTSGGGRRWRVRDQNTKRGVEIWPDPHDGVGGDPFGGPDVWAVRYHPNETDDGGSTGGVAGDAQHIDQYVNGESIDGEDVVLWYRIGHRHDHGLECTYQGPRIKLIGSW